MIYITGDTHSEFERLSYKNWPEGRGLNKSDYVIVCGDFGLLWNSASIGSEKYWTRWLNEKPWTTLFIDGNHENFDRLYRLPEVTLFGSKVGKVSDSIYHLKRGEIYTIEGKTFFCMGGAESTDKKSKQNFLSWWKEEIPSYVELKHGFLNLQNFGRPIDYIITHSISDSILQGLYGEVYCKENRSLNDFYEFLQYNVKFKKWFCGHFHIDQDVENVYFIYERILKLE